MAVQGLVCWNVFRAPIATASCYIWETLDSQWLFIQLTQAERVLAFSINSVMADNIQFIYGKLIKIH